MRYRFLIRMQQYIIHTSTFMMWNSKSNSQAQITLESSKSAHFIFATNMRNYLFVQCCRYLINEHQYPISWKLAPVASASIVFFFCSFVADKKDSNFLYMLIIVSYSVLKVEPTPNSVGSVHSFNSLSLFFENWQPSLKVLLHIFCILDDIDLLDSDENTWFERIVEFIPNYRYTTKHLLVNVS